MEQKQNQIELELLDAYVEKGKRTIELARTTRKRIKTLVKSGQIAEAKQLQKKLESLYRTMTDVEQEDIEQGFGGKTFNKVKGVFEGSKTAYSTIKAGIMSPSGIKVDGVPLYDLPKTAGEKISGFAAGLTPENPYQFAGLAAGAGIAAVGTAATVGAGYAAYKYFNKPEDVAKFEESKPPNENVMQATPLGDAGRVYTDRIKETFLNLNVTNVAVPLALAIALVMVHRRR